jgi:hypothetical protein
VKGDGLAVVDDTPVGWGKRSDNLFAASTTATVGYASILNRDVEFAGLEPSRETVDEDVLEILVPDHA